MSSPTPGPVAKQEWLLSHVRRSGLRLCHAELHPARSTTPSLRGQISLSIPFLYYTTPLTSVALLPTPL